MARVAFDPEDVDAAFKELDARYLAGEAAAYADMWSVIAGAHAGANRRELPPTTPDPVYVDHRPLVSIEEVDPATSLRAVWEITSAFSVYIEAVHRLDELGAVVTQVVNGTSHEGLDVEWRMIEISTVEDDLYSRVEIFDDADLDAALARFEELHAQAPRLENEASRVFERFWACFAARDWGAMAKLLAADSSTDDRRRVVDAGFRQGRKSFIADMQAVADVGTDNLTSTVIATRGERAALGRVRSAAFQTEVLTSEINADNRIAAVVVIDPDYMDAAIAELDARYLAAKRRPTRTRGRPSQPFTSRSIGTSIRR